MKKNIFILLMLVSLSLQAQPKKVTGMYCFTEEANAQQALLLIKRQYEVSRAHGHHQAVANKLRERLDLLRPEIELGTDTADQFGRKFCLIAYKKKLQENDLRIIGSHQAREDDTIYAKNRKLALSLKDPWGGEKLDLTGKPKAFRSCHKKDSVKAEELECDDLIITAKKGEDNVVEYRFWLGFQTGDGLSVYKSAANHMELSKVMARLKKDKKEHKYSFAPKGSTDSELVENAKLGGE